MPMILTSAALAAGTVAVAGWWHGWRRAGAREAIRGLDVGPAARQGLRKTYPGLDDAAIADIERGLRQYFAAQLAARGRLLAMPSNAVDALWHAFILDTRRYEAFCRQAFGRMLHHVPDGSMARTADAAAAWNAALDRTWWHACRLEGRDPGQPGPGPLLFTLDERLGIPDGQRHGADGRHGRFRRGPADALGGCGGVAAGVFGGGDAASCGGDGGGGCGGGCGGE